MRIDTDLSLLTADLRRKLTPVASAATEALRASLDDEGSGRNYSGLPYQSSAEGEYPSYQSGELLDSIAFEVDGDTAHIGALDNPPDHAFWLHVKPESGGGRPFVLMAMLDRQHREDMEDALGDAP